MNRLCLTLLTALFIFTSCEEDITPPPIEPTAHSIIPIPVEFNQLNTTDFFGSNSTLELVNGDEITQSTMELFNVQAQQILGHDFEFSYNGTGNIKVQVGGDLADIGQEGYKLTINEELMFLEANSNKGVFYGLQTILQLLATNKEGEVSSIPTGVIVDYPRFEYRSFMLDVVRHFLTVDEVKKFIDVIALYKINFLHLHLTDDQGWRIEIDSWPDLTLIGGQSEVGGEPSGFYTKEDYQAILAYAAERFITVVPEIDMPGHINAALNAYPELTCDDVAPPVYTGTGVGFSSICVGDEDADRFMKDVIREVAEMTPGPYIHIGADEVFLLEKYRFKLFVDAAQAEIESHGKKMIGWNESVESTLDNNDVIQFWKDDLAYQAKHAADAGAEIIMSPWYRAYYGDYQTEQGGINIGEVLYGGNLATTVKEAYEWNPANYVYGVDESHILGVESCIWSEVTDLIEEFEYFVYPRLMGHAEIGWSPQNQRVWSNYRNRLNNHEVVMDAYNINYYDSPYLEWE